MPDTGPNYSLPPGYFVQSGDTILPSQHNPVLEDLAAALNARMMRNGSSPMTGNLQMGSKQITGLAAASQPHHAPRLDQVTPRSAFLLSASALSLATNEMIYASGANTAGKTTLTAFARTLLDDANAAAARTTLGLGPVSTDSIVPVSRGGTGSSTAAGARNNLGLGAVATDDTVPVSRGGTGATTASAARNNLSAQAASGMLDAVSGISGAGVGFLVKTGGDNLVLRSFAAGNGITIQNPGGSEGTPSIAMGTPSSITRTSTNSTTSTSHTHALNGSDFRDMLANYQIINAQGSLMFARYSGGSELLFGATTAGSNLTPSSASAAQPVASITGSWRCLGYAMSGERTLFIRITE